MERIDYKIIRSNRKTLALTVDKKGEIVVRAPFGYPAKELDAFVLRHTVWIEKRLKKIAAKPKLDLANGAVLTLFGTNYTIAEGRTRLEDGRIFLPEAGREEALTRFLKKFTGEVLAVLTARIAAKHGFRYARVRISSARTRWGSCNRKGIIAYTFRMAFLPPQLVEYVVVHELVHTVYFDHSPDFWRGVERVLPDWKTRRKLLKSSSVMGFL